MTDVVERLRKWAIAVTAVPASDLMDEAAGEIERLRHRLRFADAVIRSGNVATLTDAEREAVEVAAHWCETPIDPVYSQTSLAAQMAAETLRGLLQRLK